MNNTKHIVVVKHIIYCLLFLALYIIQSVPHLFTIAGVKPIWAIPAAIAVAMLEGEFLGGIYGAFAGLLCDIGGFLLFGFNGFLTCLYCIAVGLLVIYLMRCNLLGCLLFVLVFMLIRGSLEFLFAFGMWGYEDVWRIYVSQTLPTVVYSVAISPLLFFLFRKLHNRFEEYMENV